MPVIVVWEENVLFNDYIAKTQSETEKDVNKTLYLCIFVLAKGLIVDVKPLQLKHLWQIFFNVALLWTVHRVFAGKHVFKKSEKNVFNILTIDCMCFHLLL